MESLISDIYKATFCVESCPVSSQYVFVLKIFCCAMYQEPATGSCNKSFRIFLKCVAKKRMKKGRSFGQLSSSSTHIKNGSVNTFYVTKIWIKYGPVNTCSKVRATCSEKYIQGSLIFNSDIYVTYPNQWSERSLLFW